MDELLDNAVGNVETANSRFGDALTTDSALVAAQIAQAQALIVIARQLTELNQKLEAMTGEDDLYRSALRVFNYTGQDLS